MCCQSRSIAALFLTCFVWSIPLAGCGPAIFDTEPSAVQPVDHASPPRKSLSAREGTASQQKTASVKIDQFAFDPASLTVAPETTVEWTNHDDVPHTVVDTEGGFKSDALDTDDVFRYTFKQPGDFRYFCSVHPHMVGEIHVKE